MRWYWLAMARVTFVLAAALAFWGAQRLPFRALGYASGEAVLKVLIWIVPALLVVMAVRRVRFADAWRRFGLGGPVWRGLLFGIAVTLPLALTLVARRSSNLSLDVLAADVLIGPFAEEVLFRGAMQPAWGLHLTAIVFGLAHLPPRRDLLPWTIAALLIGYALGALTAASGNLAGALVAHFTINVFNLRQVGRVGHQRFHPRRKRGTLGLSTLGEPLLDLARDGAERLDQQGGVAARVVDVGLHEHAAARRLVDLDVEPLREHPLELEHWLPARPERSRLDGPDSGSRRQPTRLRPTASHRGRTGRTPACGGR